MTNDYYMRTNYK